MAKNQNKTVATAADPQAFVEAVEHKTRKADAETLLEVYSRITGKAPKMWGPTLIGYGSYHYKYDSGREGDFLAAGFSPRKQNMTLYIMPGYQDLDEKLSRLGKHKLGKSCLYINKLADVDMDVLEEIISFGWDYMTEHYDVSD